MPIAINRDVAAAAKQAREDRAAKARANVWDAPMTEAEIVEERIRHAHNTAKQAARTD